MHTTQFSNVSTPYQKIPDACRSTGLSQYYLRKGCKDGTVPHIRSGTVYLVDVPALLEKLRREATGQIGGDDAVVRFQRKSKANAENAQRRWVQELPPDANGSESMEKRKMVSRSGTAKHRAVFI